MTSGPRWGASRVTAALLTTTLVSASAAGLASSAVADDHTTDPRAAARTLGADGTHGTLLDPAAESRTASTIAFTDAVHHPQIYDLRTTDGTTLRTYCVKVTVPPRPGVRYHEIDWSQAHEPFRHNGAFIKWILGHSYPTVPKPATVAAAAGVAHPEADHHLLPDVVAGTQAAIWHYSDGIAPDPHARAHKIPPVAEQVYQYLTSAANTGQQEPPVSLALTPHLIQGHAGETIGWLTLHTSTTDHKTDLTLTGDVPNGAHLVDAHGDNTKTGADQDRFGVRVPADTKPGHVTVTAHGATTVTAGRVFIGDAGPAHTQTLILAKSETVNATAHAVAAWTSTKAPGTPTPPATPGTPAPPAAAGALAHTGTDDTPLLIGAGLALFALGSTLVFFLRRKNRPSTDASKN